MNDSIILNLKKDILYRYTDKDGFLTDDLLERYDGEYKYGDREELIALWIAELLSIEIIADEMKIPFDFNKSFRYGMKYLKYV